MKSFLGSLVDAFQPRNSSPVPLSNQAGRFSLFGGSRDSKTVQMETYGSVGTLFQIVSSLALGTSKVEWHQHRKRQRAVTSATCQLCGQQGVSLLDTPTQFGNLWSKPNDFTSGQEFVEGFQQHIDLTGEGYWVLELSDLMGMEIPTGMWYVRPDRMTPVPSPKDYLVGWFYTGPDGERVPLGLNQVVQLKMPNPLDPYRGMGPVQSILADINSAQYSAEWNANFFKNGAEPGGLIKAPNMLDDNDFNRIRDRWNDNHKGVSNAHRVAILEGGLEYVPRAFTQKDMQFVQLREVSADVIREAYGYPEFAQGKLENANKASGKAAADWYTENLIVPRLDRIKDALNYKFLPLFGTTADSTEFAYCNPIPKDPEEENSTRDSKATVYKTLIDAGVHPEDAALVAGLPPMRVTAMKVQPASNEGAAA